MSTGDWVCIGVLWLGALVFLAIVEWAPQLLSFLGDPRDHSDDEEEELS